MHCLAGQQGFSIAAGQDDTCCGTKGHFAVGMQLLESAEAKNIFPSDVLARAKKYLAAIPGGTGAYSDSRGAMVLRQDIAKVGGLWPQEADRKSEFSEVHPNVTKSIHTYIKQA